MRTELLTMAAVAIAFFTFGKMSGCRGGSAYYGDNPITECIDTGHKVSECTDLAKAVHQCPK